MYFDSIKMSCKNIFLHFASIGAYFESMKMLFNIIKMQSKGILIYFVFGEHTNAFGMYMIMFLYHLIM